MTTSALARQELVVPGGTPRAAVRPTMGPARDKRKLAALLLVLAKPLFGPAFVLTSIHFFMSFGTLDAASSSHPPARLRLRFHLLNSPISPPAMAGL